jgi:hypothetical protein
MARQSRKRRSADPDAIYAGAEIELPWVVSHIGGSPTPWDSEFAF